MIFYPQKKEPLSLNVTPLIDVVFLLLIFFVTSTTFLEETALNVTLPSLQTRQALSSENRILITISAKGDYRINDQALPNQAMDTLSHAIFATQPFSPDTTVVVAADAKAPHQAVMRAMDAAGTLGYAHIQLQGDIK